MPQKSYSPPREQAVESATIDSFDIAILNTETVMESATQVTFTTCATWRYQPALPGLRLLRAIILMKGKGEHFDRTIDRINRVEIYDCH